MWNKALIFAALFFCFCIQVFSQIDSGDQEESTTIDIDDFIDGFWYQRYLPIENLGEYHEYSAFLSEMKENNQEDFRRGISESSESIQYLYEIVMSILVDEDRRVTQQLNALKENFELDEEVIAAVNMYESFSAEINENTFPVDKDGFVECIRIIDELYSRLITRARYVLIRKPSNVAVGNLTDTDLPQSDPTDSPRHDNVYDVAEGDYLKKIAARVYGNESLWKHIYRENIDNRSFLPDPNNADLILPGVSIRIPPIPSNDL